MEPVLGDATANTGTESREVGVTSIVGAKPGPGGAACVTSTEPGKWGVASDACPEPERSLPELGTENVAVDADTEPEMGKMSVDAGTRPCRGDILNDAGAEHGTWEVTSEACTDPIRAWKSSKFTQAGGASFASTVGPLIIALPWALLILLAEKQAQLLHSINSRAPSASVLLTTPSSLPGQC